MYSVGTYECMQVVNAPSHVPFGADVGSNAHVDKEPDVSSEGDEMGEVVRPHDPRVGRAFEVELVLVVLMRVPEHIPDTRE